MGDKEKKKEPAEVVEEKPEAEESVEEEGLSQQPMIMVMQAPSGGGDKDEDKIRCLGLIGDINEEKASETMYGILSLRNAGKREVLVDENKPEGEIKTEQLPFEMIISTHGGNASDMFGIYDLMRDTMEQGCEIHTFALGKVMSAGVLLLAAGTHGERRIGKNCRVMVHNVIAGNHGSLPNLTNELEAIQQLQDDYVDALVQNTKLSKKKLKKLLNEKVNVYLSAEEAVEYGIADIII